ncbi:MAG: response regulator [Sphingomonadaceae bacterium]
MKLLLADDQPLFLERLQRLLAAHGVEVAGTAGDGFEALAKARELHPDAILMDLHMPRCNGLEATRMIKAEMPDAKIVMLTDSAEDEDLSEAIESGASDYLLKSLNADQFFDLLSRLESTPSGESSVDLTVGDGSQRQDQTRRGNNGEAGIAVPCSTVGSPASPRIPDNQVAIYQEIVDSALAATGAIIVAMVLIEPGGRHGWVVASSGLDSEPVQNVLAAARNACTPTESNRFAIDVHANLWSRKAYLTGEPVAAALEQIGEGVADPRLIRMGALQAGIRHAFLCPLKVEGQVEGAIVFLTSEPLTDAQRRTSEAFAHQVSLTMENTRLIEALQAQLKEVQQSRQQLTMADERLRRSIAELLHGRVQTKLLMAWHRLGDCIRLLEEDPAKAREVLEQTREEIDNIREQEIRRASHLLHPSIIRVGLVPAIRSLVASFEDGLNCSVQIDPSLAEMDDPIHNRIPERLRLVAYRTVEEALSNAYRHAGATQVQVCLRMDTKGCLVVEVEDDGRGFDTAHTNLGLGLSNIAGRVDQVGGSWQVVSQPGKGTWLSVLLPLEFTSE